MATAAEPSTSGLVTAAAVAAIDSDADRLAREVISSFPNRTRIRDVFDTWDRRDRALPEASADTAPHIDALCAALRARQLSPATTALDMVWHVIHATNSGDLFDSMVARSPRYRDYQPGPPLRSWWQTEAKEADRLRLLVLAGEYQEVQQRLSAVFDPTNRDDITVELVTYLDDATLVTMNGSSPGRDLLERLSDELTAGKAGADEQAQAKRLETARSASVTTEAYQKAVTSRDLRVFPYRKGGISASSAIPWASFVGAGKIFVRMNMNVRTNTAFDQDTRTLPLEAFTAKGMVLVADQIVGVRLYDEGGRVDYVPAMRLVALKNEAVTHTFEKIGEVAGYGLGGLGSVGAKAGLAAKTMMWVERATLVVGTLASAISEHRGWIIRRFGPRGRAFVDAAETVNSAVAIFGVARVAFEMPKLVLSLGAGVASLRRARDTAPLTSKESAAFNAAVSPADDLRARLEQIGREHRVANDNIETIAMQRRSAPGEVRVTHEPLPGSAANDNVESPLHGAANSGEEVLEEQARVAAGAEGHEPVHRAREESPYLVEASSAGGRGKPTTGKATPSASRGGASKSSGSTGGGGSRPRTPPGPHERVASQPGATGKRGTWSEAMHKAATKAWKEFMPERYWIDMAGAPESAARTSQGWQRDSEWFWTSFHQRFKNEWWFSKRNQEWAKLGQPCEIDELWIKRFPAHGYFRGDRLVHHHIESGAYAAAIPRSFHEVLHGPLHYVDIFNR